MNIAWYQTSFRTRKILTFMIMKTREPCVLTAGKMFVISMDTFSTVRLAYFACLIKNTCQKENSIYNNQHLIYKTIKESNYILIKNLIYHQN